MEEEFYSLHDEVPFGIDPLTEILIFEWLAAQGSLTSIPAWVKSQVDPQFLDQTKYFGRLYYCKYTLRVY